MSTEGPVSRIDQFLQTWGQGTGAAPLFVLVGGAAGVGKSTLAEGLRQRVPPLTHVSTALIRTILRATQPELPWIGRHTYDLDSIGQFRQQSEPIMACVNQLARFAATERQLYLVEGSNLVPGLFSAPAGARCVELYLRVTDPARHRRMSGGPNHDRFLTNRQFERCREIQAFIEAEARRHQKPVAEYDAGLEVALSLIEQALQEPNA